MEIYYHQILSEDVGRIELPGNMLDVESVVLDPLANWVFAKFNVLGRFWGHIIGPLDAHIIVIVQDSGGINVGKSVARIRDTAREIAEVNNFLQGCITGAYLGLAEAKGHAFRTFAKPATGPPFLKMMPPFMLLNLNRGRIVTSATELPSWEPQHTLLYA